MNILVTGGASGLGRAITRQLAGNPAHAVWFTYHRSAGAARELEGACANAHAIRCDFSAESEVAALAGRLEALDLDALVHNALAGGLARQHFHKIPLDAFRAGFVGNVLPVVALTQQAIGLFRKKHRGRIVTVLTAALVGKPPVGYAEYGAAKAYLQQLAKTWAVENASFHITSNCVLPGYMATALHRDADERVVEEMIQRHPLKRLLEPAEVAAAVEFFLTCSEQVNGANLVLNAGTELA